MSACVQQVATAVTVLVSTEMHLVDPESTSPDTLRPRYGPGVYVMQRVRNPISKHHRAKWLVMPGTKIGAAEKWLRRLSGVTVT